MRFVKTMDSLHPVDEEAATFLIQAPEGAELEFKVSTGKRTGRQNNAIWKYCEMLANALNAAGFDMRTYPFKKQGLTLPWSKDSVMATFWRPVQEAMLGKESTRDLEPKEVNVIYEALDRANSERTGVHVEFPSNS